MEIKIYNSLTNTIEPFKPIKPNELSIYVCGPTVYNDIHIGNARPVVFFDTVCRFFKTIGYNVKYVSNFTDIDDKIIKKAKEEGLTEKELAEKYITRYLRVCNEFNCEPAFCYPRVTEWIGDIADFIKELVQKGFAYQVGDNVYFRVRSSDKYGILSNQKLDDLEVGSRIDVESDKEDPRDFVLWKLTNDEGIKWDTEFGMGRPGWHTECCVMIDKIFGGPIDIHGGGNDLKFPHHENEIAQVYALHNHYIANYWIHNGRVDFNNQKMSKSLGNTVGAQKFLDEYNHNACRLMLVQNNYRQNVNFTYELMTPAQKDWEKMEKTYISLFRTLELANGLKEGEPIFDYKEAFLSEIANDFNTPNAITVLYQVMKDVNVLLRQKDKDYNVLNSYLKTIDMMFYVLGLKPEIKLLTEDQKKLVTEWYTARTNKDFEKADVLRQEINNQGIIL
ncbi:MAG: cysteine--tRNA ligase [Bacilli bacterium]|nr:cysteine--tRNA ligase [Bacilli bacterium]